MDNGLKKSYIVNALYATILVVVSSNTFIKFLPDYISKFLGLLVTCIILFECQLATTRKLYGSFAELLWVRFFIIILAVPGYFIPLLKWSISAFQIYMAYTSIILLLSWPMAKAWKSASAKDIPARQFWRVWCQIMERDANKEWKKVITLPSSKTKKFEEFLWWYFPGFVLVFIAFVFCSIFLLLSIYSSFFIAVFLIWLVIFLRQLRKPAIKDRWHGRPRMKKDLLTLGSLLTTGRKGLCGWVSIFTGLGLSGALLFVNLSFLITSFRNHRPFVSIFDLFYWVHLTALILVCVYQFIFWYAISGRFPHFAALWRNEALNNYGKALPVGGLFSFGLSWICFSFLSMIRAYFSDSMSGFVEIGKSFAVWSFLLFVNIFYFILVMFSAKKWSEKEVSVANLQKDNYRIPLAASISLVCVSLEFAKFYVPLAMLAAYLTVMNITIFYTADLRRFLRRKYFHIFKDEGILSLIEYVVIPVLFLPTIFFMPEITMILFMGILILGIFGFAITLQDRRLRRKADEKRTHLSRYK